MTAEFRNPALEWFVQQFADDVLVAQVSVRREGSSFELRHVDDRDTPAEKLQLEIPEGARAIAQWTQEGAFRPLKSAPNLRRGWRIRAESERELQTALDRLYPGFIADLFATQTGSPHVTHYREFTNRQTGMYRITTFLSDSDAGTMISKCCSAHYCLKQRLWTVEGLPVDAAGSKSVIPCLEPCAVLLEYARKVVRTSQRDGVPTPMAVAQVEPDARQEE